MSVSNQINALSNTIKNMQREIDSLKHFLNTNPAFSVGDSIKLLGSKTEFEFDCYFNKDLTINKNTILRGETMAIGRINIGEYGEEGDLFVKGDAVFNGTLRVNGTLIADKMQSDLHIKDRFIHLDGKDNLFGIKSGNAAIVYDRSDKTLKIEDDQIPANLSCNRISAFSMNVFSVNTDCVLTKEIKGDFAINGKIVSDLYLTGALECTSVKADKVDTNDLIIKQLICGNATITDIECDKVNSHAADFDTLTVKNLKTPFNTILEINVERLANKYAPSSDIVGVSDEQTLSNKSFSSPINMSGMRIENVAEPMHKTDAATKEYVDRLLETVYMSKFEFLEPVTYLCNEQILFETLDNNNTQIISTTQEDIQIDGRYPDENDIILFDCNLKGIYVVINSGADDDNWMLIKKMDLLDKRYHVFVEKGQENGGCTFIVENNTSILIRKN